jgi:hypothetical protein
VSDPAAGKRPSIDPPARPAAAVLDYGTGRRDPRTRRPRPPILSVVVIGILLFPLVLALAYPLARRFPRGWNVTYCVQMPSRKWDEYGQLALLELWAHGTGLGDRARFATCEVQFRAYRTLFGLTVDLRDMSARVSLPGTQSYAAAPLTREVLLDWLTRADFDPGSSETAQSADALLYELNELRAGRLRPNDPNVFVQYRVRGHSLIPLGYSGHLLWLPWYTIWCLPPWLAAWTFAARPTVRRYRRKLTEFETFPRPSAAGPSPA